MAMVKRFEVYLVNLESTIGSEIQKTRPCVVISPDEMNQYIRTVIIAPMTTATKNYPTRVNLTFAGKKGQIVLDQIRTIDKTRLINKIGEINSDISQQVIDVLQEMFSY